MKRGHYVTYGSYDSMIEGSAKMYGCTPELFREVNARHPVVEHDTALPWGSREEALYQQAMAVMKELKTLGYSYKSEA